MILGMTLSTFTALHVVISLAALASGVVVFLGLIAGKQLDRWTAFFLATTVATSVTGFMFPFHQFLPSHLLGAVSLVVLAAAILARYGYGLSGAWRRVYITGSAIALYLNAFVAVVQSFQKIPALRALAPTQSEPPFIAAQIAILVLFAGLGIRAGMRHADMPAQTVQTWK